MDAGHIPARWVFYESATGHAVVLKEIGGARLGLAAEARLQALLDRIAEGRALPGDVKPLRAEIVEARLDVAARTFRLLFARLPDRRVLLALSFFRKQTRKTPQHEIERAMHRLREWQPRPIR
jgi:phage-related protein